MEEWAGFQDPEEKLTTVAVKIKLARFGKIREPFYRVVVADARTRRSGRAIEAIGKYHPKADPSVIEIDSDRAQYWLGVGAQPTESVLSLLKVTGDWQKFRGEPGAEGTLQGQKPRPDRKALYEAALAQTLFLRGVFLGALGQLARVAGRGLLTPTRC